MLSQLASPEILIHVLYFLTSLLYWRETCVTLAQVMSLFFQELLPVAMFARKYIRGR